MTNSRSRQERVIDAIKQNNIGLTLSELANKVDISAFDNNKDKISSTLNALLAKNHVKKSGSPARWAMTPQGRAYYSELNQEPKYETQKNGSTEHAKTENNAQDTKPNIYASVEMANDHAAQPLVLETDHRTAHRSATVESEKQTVENTHHSDRKQAADNVETKPDSTPIEFDLSDTLDFALYGLVNLIRDVANQAPDPIVIEHKDTAMALLETMESNELINGPHRATFARIRQAVAQMDDAL